MIPEEKGIVDAFHRLYYDGPAGEGRVHHRTTWMGTPCLKCPMDLWAYQEILAEVRPDLVVETGTHLGGSALFLAHMLDLLGKGELVTVDILERPDRPRHPRIRYVTGSSGDWNVVASLFAGRPARGEAPRHPGLGPREGARLEGARPLRAARLGRQLPDRRGLERQRAPGPAGLRAGALGGGDGISGGEPGLRAGRVAGEVPDDVQSRGVPEAGPLETRKPPWPSRWIDDESVSRRHARISVGPEGATIEDLGSKNGTYLGGKKIRGPALLSDRDAVKIGPASLTIRVMKRTGSTRSTRGKGPR